MKTLFISDLHLSPDQPELTRLATDFILQHQDCSAIYILGDIFNTWLGDDLILPEYQPFITALQTLSEQQVKLYLMVGNRDFMLGKAFARQVGGVLLSDPTVHEFADQRVLIMHGDSLCIDDQSYQRYRRIVRNRFLQACFRNLPVSFRQRISDKIKAQSKQQKRHKTAKIMDVNHDEVHRLMTHHQAEILIHGHTHRPAIHQLNTANPTQHRIVLGDWHQQPSFLIYQHQVFSLFDSRLKNGRQDLRL